MRTVHESREKMDGNINLTAGWTEFGLYATETAAYSDLDVSRLLGDQRVSFNLTADVPAQAICHDHEDRVHG